MSRFLEKLNPSQREAVTHEAGPLLIIAGPGSGKTETVANSIAYAIEVSGVLPKRIAAFTFGRKAKDDLIDRVSKIMGKKLANDIWISTFHSFCGSVVKRVLDSFRTNEGRIRAEINLTQHHIFPGNTKKYVIDPHYINTLKDALKKSEQLVDDDNPFTKVQLSTYTLFRDVPEVKTEWQEKFDLIFVDEYQDTDHVQHKIIKVLVERHQDLRVVGDDDQGIYGWRDADIQNILDFEKNYPNAKVISLGQNYRSTRQIVNTSRAIIDFNPDRREKKIFTNNPEGYKVKHLHCEDRNAEASTIAGFIYRAIQSGWNANDFAILYRTREQATPFKEAFGKLEIQSHVVEGSVDMPANGVSIMTIYQSKGLEFPNVFVAGVCSGLLPHHNSKEKDWDEELRLLYVAMTRAENWLCLSSYDKDFSDKNTSFKRGPSRFLDFIPQSMVKRVRSLDNTDIPSRIKKVKDTGEDAEKSPKNATSSRIKNQTVLGIDPGKENVGWAITQRQFDRYICKKYGNERPHGQPIGHKINELIMKYSPDAISVEKLEGAKDEWFLHVAGCVAQIRSIADQQNIEWHSYSPQDVKYAVTGNKKAFKEEVQYAVKQVCNLKKIPEPHHSADAIATSLCYLRNYLNYSRFQNNARMKEYYDSGIDYLDIRQYNRAIVEFEQSINNAPMIDPMYTKAYCGLARAYLGLDKLEEAENSAKEARRLDPNHPPTLKLLDDITQAYYNRALTYLKAEQYDKAITEFNTVLNKDPNFINAYCGLGWAYFKQGNLRQSENYTNKALKLEEHYHPVLQIRESIKQEYCELARGYLNQDNLTEAENLAKQALRLEENYHLALELLAHIKQAYYNRGHNHLGNQRYDEAIAAFKNTIKKYESFTEAYCGLGWAYLGQGKFIEVEKAVNAAFRLEDNNQDALRVLEAIKQKYYEHGMSYLEQDDLVSAQNSARAALRLDSDYQTARELLENIKQIHIDKGKGSLRQSELELAQKAAEVTLRIDPSFQPALNLLENIKQAYYNRGCNYLDNLQYVKATTAFEETINRYPKFIAAHCGLGQAYLRKGNLTKAEDSAKKALRLELDHQLALELLEDIRQAYYKHGIASIEASEYVKGIEFLLNAYSINPNNKEVCVNLADAYCLMDDEVNAANWYQKVIDIDQNDKIAHTELGSAYYNMGKYEKGCGLTSEGKEVRSEL